MALQAAGERDQAIGELHSVEANANTTDSAADLSGDVLGDDHHEHDSRPRTEPRPVDMPKGGKGSAKPVSAPKQKVVPKLLKKRSGGCCGGRVCGSRSEFKLERLAEKTYAKPAGAEGWLRPATRVTEFCTASAVGCDESAMGWGNNLPVIIVPGFLSSSMMVRRSDVKPAWENSRVWFSLQKLGGNMLTEAEHAPHHHPDAWIEVCVHEARNLMSADADGKSDPFVRVTMLNSQKEHTAALVHDGRVVESELNPQFDDDFTLGSGCDVRTMAYILVEVRDVDAAFDDSLGSALIPIDEFRDAGSEVRRHRGHLDTKPDDPVDIHDCGGAAGRCVPGARCSPPPIRG